MNDHRVTHLCFIEMFLKQSLKGNKPSNSGDNTASREANIETVPIYFNPSLILKL